MAAATKAPKRSQIPVVDVLQEVKLRGRRLTAELSELVLSATASVSVDSISDVTLTFYDPQFKLLASGLFEVGGSCDFRTFQQEITAVQTGSAGDGLGQITVRCRAAAIGKLKRRTGTKTLRKASPSEFVIAECKALKIPYVVQASAKRKIVARDTKKNADSNAADKPSTYTTFERLARELGFVFFESAGTIYFGKPTWLRQRDMASYAVVTYGTGTTSDLIGVPQFSDELDADDGVTVSFQVPRSRVAEFMPGQLCEIQFPLYGARKYLVKSLSFPITGDGYAAVTAGVPRNPKPEGQSKDARKGSGNTATSATNSDGVDRRGSTQLGDVLRRAGFSGDALEVAAGVAIASSGGAASGGGFYVNASYVEQNWFDEKWGPRAGIFADRTVKDPAKESGVNKTRLLSRLRGDALYAARLAHSLSGGGKDWSSYPAYVDGSWKAYRGKLAAHCRDYPGLPIKDPRPDDPPRSTGVSGRMSALAFAARALAQAGDAYVYGAEVSLTDPNPGIFDCSELVQWAAAQVGCYMPDGSAAQSSYCASKGTRISVEAAIATRGALLFASGHVAISLGDGRTIEALNRDYGVRVMNARGRQTVSWYAGGRVPGMRY